METVAFYSYKGGVGRTLLVANTAQFLAMSGRRVVALDLDLEAPGLHQKLANPEVLSRAEAGSLRGAVDALLAALEDEAVHCSLRDMAVEVDLPSGINGSLVLIPAGSAPSHAYWGALERLSSSLRTDQRNGGLLEAVLELQARIADELAPDFLLIDSRTGITELGGLATSLLADRVVCMTTTAPESVEGTRVVADALRAAPRLPSQQPLRIDFLVTRVPSGAIHSSNVTRLLEQLGNSVAVLPHDSAIANEEQVLAGWEPARFNSYDDDHSTGTELFSATLRWIAEAFPGHRQAAVAARRRMVAVHRAWNDLTQTSERVRGGTRGRKAWPLEQLRQRVRFTSGKKSRQADIVAYDRPTDDSGAKPLMIIEYAHHEDCDTVARWWLEEIRAPIVAVLSLDADRRLYSIKTAWDPRASPSNRSDLPLPHDFEALSDPADVSVDALLDSVHRGRPEYLERLVTEWIHCSAAGLHGGVPWRPQLAKKIVDGLARVDDIELARQVLRAASTDSLYHRMWMGGGIAWLDEQVLAELFTPLLWRLPPEAAIELMRGYGRPFGPPPGFVAVSLLARDMLGLRYDPDATFRTEGQRILERSGPEPETDQDRGLYRLAPAFEHTQITFELSSDLPPRLLDSPSLLSELIATRQLVTTGLLGDYEPSRGKVVLYRTAIAECADKLALRARHVGSVTLIHETIHAISHLGRDLDGRMWPEFALPAANSPLFEASWFHEALAQYFTYQHIVRLRDPALLHAFEALTTKQAPAYRTWQRLLSLPIEDVRSWFMSVRRGVGLAAPSSHVLFEAMRDES